MTNTDTSLFLAALFCWQEEHKLLASFEEAELLERNRKRKQLAFLEQHRQACAKKLRERTGSFSAFSELLQAQADRLAPLTREEEEQELREEQPLLFWLDKLQALELATNTEEPVFFVGFSKELEEEAPETEGGSAQGEEETSLDNS